MAKEIMIAVCSSILGALIAFLGSSALGLFEKTITESQMQTLAQTIVDTDNYREVILNKMAQSGNFIGPRGDSGPEGVQGPIGPPRSGLEDAMRHQVIQVLSVIEM